MIRAIVVLPLAFSLPCSPLRAHENESKDAGSARDEISTGGLEAAWRRSGAWWRTFTQKCLTGMVH